MDPRFIVSREDRTCWPLLERIDKPTLGLVKFFKAHVSRLYAALSDGRFIAVGDNSDGFLGLGHKKEVKTYEEIKQLRGKSIKDIACGWLYFMVLTENGEVWGWGHNDCGQIGLGMQAHYLAPVRVIDGGIIAIKCGQSHTVALKKCGKVLNWGMNDIGQLGIGNTASKFSPVSPASLKGKCVIITQIEAGSEHSIAVSNEGKAYGWGWNEKYQLGQGHKKDVLRPLPIDIHKKVIKSVTCSRLHSFFRTEDGLHYMNCVYTGRLKLIEIETDVHIDRITCVRYYLLNESSASSLFVAMAGEQLYYWGNIRNTDMVDVYEGEIYEDLIPTDLTLSQALAKHSVSNMYSELLYLQPDEEEKTVKETISDSALQKRFSQNVFKLFDSPRLSDIEFVFDDHRSIKAHRVILIASSQHLATELSTTWQALSSVSITTYPYPVFHHYLSYLYAHTLSIEDIEQLVSLIHLAKDYNEVNLREACIEQLSAQLNTDNCSRIYEIAGDLQLEQLETQAVEIITKGIDRDKLNDFFNSMGADKLLKFSDKFLHSVKIARK